MGFLARKEIIEFPQKIKIDGNKQVLGLENYPLAVHLSVFFRFAGDDEIKPLLENRILRFYTNALGPSEEVFSRRNKNDLFCDFIKAFTDGEKDSLDGLKKRFPDRHLLIFRDFSKKDVSFREGVSCFDECKNNLGILPFAGYNLLPEIIPFCSDVFFQFDFFKVNYEKSGGRRKSEERDEDHLTIKSRESEVMYLVANRSSTEVKKAYAYQSEVRMRLHLLTAHPVEITPLRYVEIRVLPDSLRKTSEIF